MEMLSHAGGVGMGMGRSVIDERLMQENRQDTLLKDIFRREIRQSRMELADVMQRLASVEQIQEQLVSLVIMRVQNAEIEAGMPEMAAATMNDATGPRIPDVIARPAEETMQMIQHQVGVANHHQRWSGVAAASAPASAPTSALHPQSLRNLGAISGESLWTRRRMPMRTPMRAGGATCWVSVLVLEYSGTIKKISPSPGWCRRAARGPPYDRLLSTDWS